MSANTLQSHLRAIEDEFYHQVDLKLIAQMREKTQREQKRQRLSQAILMHDPTDLDQLIDLGINEDTVAVFILVPLVFVAWADGRITEAERETIVDIVSRYSGSSPEAAIRLFEQWLEEQPRQQVWNAWEAYVRALQAESAPATANMMTDQLLEYAQRVAESSSSFLSFLRIEKSKQAALERLRDTLKAA